MNINTLCRNLFRISLSSILLVFVAALDAQAPWSVNPAGFANSGQIEAVVVLDGLEVDSGYLGAFVGDECRGVIEGDLFPPTGKTIFSLLIYSNESSGELITFKYYDDTADQIYQIQENIEFESDMRGNATTPTVLNAVTNSAPVANCPDESALTAPPGPITFDLCVIFSDPDGDELTYDATTSSEGIINWTSACELEFTSAVNGTTTLTLTATDGEYQAECQYSFTVSEINEAPELTSPIGMIKLDEGFGNYSINLDIVFSDPDGDDLTYTAVSADPGIVATTVNSSELIINEVTSGNTTVTVTASDGEFETEDESVVIIVASVSQPPWEVNASEYLYSGQIDAVVLVNGVEVTNGVLTAFVGTDCRGTVEGSYFTPNGKTIFSLIVYSNSSSGDFLTFRYFDPVNQVVHVIDDVIPFTSDMVMGGATTPVVLNITSDNNLPQVEQPVDDQEVDEHFATLELDLADVFSDQDADVLSYSAAIYDESLATLEVSGTTLTITEAGTGVSFIEVFASDGSLTVSDRFSFTVNEVNDEPVVESTMPDQLLSEGFAAANIDISGTFSDPDGDVLSYSSSSSDEAVVTVAISGSNLVITEVGIGSSTVSVCVDDGEFQLCEELLVEVEKQNQAPQVMCPGDNDTIVVEGSGSVVLESICSLFTDPDGDVLTYSASSSDDGIATVDFTDCTLTISETGTGTATITFCASDGEYSKCCDYSITIAKENELGVSVMGVQYSDGDSLKFCEGDTLVTVVVTSDIPWETEFAGEWVTAEKDGDQNIVLTISENTTGSDRSGSIVVRDTQDHVLNIVLFQSTNCTPGTVSTYGTGGFTVYPNPTKEVLIIEPRAGVQTDEMDIYFSTMEGQIIRHLAKKGSAGEILMLNIGHLNTGVYILSIFEFNKPIYSIPVFKE